MVDKIIGRIQGMFFGGVVVLGLLAGGLIMLILFIATATFDFSWFWWLPIMVSASCLAKILVGILITWPREIANEWLNKNAPWFKPAVFWSVVFYFFVQLTQQ